MSIIYQIARNPLHRTEYPSIAYSVVKPGQGSRYANSKKPIESSNRGASEHDVRLDMAMFPVVLPQSWQSTKKDYECEK